MTNKKKQNKGKGRKTSSKNQNQRNNQSGSGLGGEIAKAMVKTLPILLSSIPFPTSGARAVATPQAGPMQVSAPSANGAVVSTSKANIKNTSMGIFVSHREYITDVVHGVPNEFELLEFSDVTPTNQKLFPWLASIAQRFETFKFEDLVFIYEPQTSTQSLGTIMLAIDYDALDEPPVNKTQLMSYKNAVRSPAWFACVNRSAKADLQKQKNYYCQNSSSTGPEDLKTTSVGKFILAFQSESDAYSAGELYVEYRVRLETPQLQNSTMSQSFQETLTAYPPTTAGVSTPLHGVGVPPAWDAVPSGPNTNTGTDLVNSIGDSEDGLSSLFSFNNAGFYHLVLMGRNTGTVATGANTNFAQWIYSVPTGSEAQIVTSGFSNGSQQTVVQVNLLTSIADLFVYVANPDEVIGIGFAVQGAGLQGTWFFTIEINPVNFDSIRASLAAEFSGIPTGASVSSHRALRLLEKRKATILAKKEADLRIQRLDQDLFNEASERRERILRLASDSLPTSSRSASKQQH